LPNGSASTLDEVLAADAEARRLAGEFAALLTADAPRAERVLH
jgi:1-deoxy-D-xylulose-5-phosphate reductoisomerase